MAFGESSLGYCVWVYSVSGIQCLQGAMRWVECLEAQYFWYCACRHGALVRVPWVWCAGFAFGVEPCLCDNAYMMYIFCGLQNLGTDDNQANESAKLVALFDTPSKVPPAKADSSIEVMLVRC